MNTTGRIVVVMAIVVAALLLLFFGGGMGSGSTMSGGMMGNGTMGGIEEMGWMWLPSLLILGLGALLVWILFGKK